MLKATSTFNGVNSENAKVATSFIPYFFISPKHGTLMLALLDFSLSSRQALQQAVVFPTVSVTGRVLFPVCNAASSEAASVLWVGGRGEIGC